MKLMSPEPSFRNGDRVASLQSGWTIRRAIADLPVRPSEFPHVGRMKKNGAPQTDACAGQHGATQSETRSQQPAPSRDRPSK
jgi:hypothetical protein